MIKFVNAKINLGLHITRKREDGYHELETLFYPVGLYNGTPENPEPFDDILEVHLCETGRDEFSFSGNAIDCPLEKNLVWKAARVFRDAIGYTGGVNIRLDKHIPDGAGLGGGSADASFTLLALNDLLNRPMSKSELVCLAAGLGADCPFFIENRPVLATGIGEAMTPFPLNLDGCWAVVVKPDIYISTREAFGCVSPRRPDHSIANILCLPVSHWQPLLINDFEAPLFSMYPHLADVKKSLLENGAVYASMSGSGSSIYGIYPDRERAEKGRNAQTDISFLIKL